MFTLLRCINRVYCLDLPFVEGLFIVPCIVYQVSTTTNNIISNSNSKIFILPYTNIVHWMDIIKI